MGREGKDTGRVKEIADAAEEEEDDEEDDGDEEEIEEVEALEASVINGDVVEGVETGIAAVEEENGIFFSISSSCRRDDSINSAPLLNASPMYSVLSCNVLLI